MRSDRRYRRRRIVRTRSISVGVPVIFLGLHIGVSFLQTYIFILLTMVYLSGAVAEEH